MVGFLTVGIPSDYKKLDTVDREVADQL